MTSAFSTDLKLELMVTGENAGTWGNKTNTNLNLIQQAIAGVESIDVGAADVTLVMSNAALSNARNAVLVFTGTLTGNREVLVPNGIEKYYILKDNTNRAGFSLTFKTVSGTGFAIDTSGSTVAAFSDGTNIIEISLNTLSGIISSTQFSSLAVTSNKLASFVVTSVKVNSFAVTSAKLATNAVTAIKITQSTITQSKLAANSVGSDQLISTGVVAGSYTASSITVDADGRITAASSGGASAGMEIPVLYAVGPTSGTYTANPAASRAGVYLYAGGGGGGGGAVANMCFNPGGAGGVGGFGFYNAPIVQPFSQPYSVGGGGGGGNSGCFTGMAGVSGNSGGNSTIANIGTVNAGGGGGGGRPPFGGGPGATGSTGTQPGAFLTYPTRTFIVQNTFGTGGNAGSGGGNAGGCTPPIPGNPGNPGVGGAIVIFENIGT